MDNIEDPQRPSQETAAVVVGRLDPGGELTAIDPLPGSYSNYTHLVTARSADGSTSRFVIRRYKVFGDYDRGEKAVREFRTLEHMAREGVPVPAPLLLDATGDLLGSPGIVTAFVPGRQSDRPEDPENLALWELVAAARPMFSPEGWISESPAVERFRAFIDEAEARLD